MDPGLPRSVPAAVIGQRLREALAVDEALGQAQAEESDQ
jgi:hypothetical protein